MEPCKDALVKDRYLLLRPLGKGGMGEVWLAHDELLASPCALKFAFKETSEDPVKRHRFLLEARLPTQASTQYVLQIRDTGAWHDRLFIAMEHLQGETLKERLQQQTTLPPAECFWILSQVARGLVAVHRLGIVHRDLKPDNIFLARSEDGEVAKIIDFGVARAPGVLDAPEELKTVEGVIVGTAAYSSIEQLDSSRSVDHRADLWALGIIAFECLTGQRPFQGGPMQIVSALLSQKRPLPSELRPDLPEALDAWWLKATDSNINARFTRADEMIQALGVALEVDGLGARTELSGESSPRTQDQPETPLVRRVRLAAGATVAVIAVGAVLFRFASPTTNAAVSFSPPQSSSLASAPSPDLSSAPVLSSSGSVDTPPPAPSSTRPLVTTSTPPTFPTGGKPPPPIGGKPKEPPVPSPTLAGGGQPKEPPTPPPATNKYCEVLGSDGVKRYEKCPAR